MMYGCLSLKRLNIFPRLTAKWMHATWVVDTYFSKSSDVSSPENHHAVTIHRNAAEPSTWIAAGQVQPVLCGAVAAMAKRCRSQPQGMPPLLHEHTLCCLQPRDAHPLSKLLRFSCMDVHSLAYSQEMPTPTAR